jgi:PAS domain S-box-containing protein
MLGMSREEVLHSTILDVIAPEEHCRLPEEIARFDDGLVHLSEWRFRRKDGSEFLGEVAGRRLASGRLQGVVRDITKRKQMADAQAKLSAIVESSEDAIISKDLNGIITSWNRGAERIFGYKAQEAVGRPVTMLMPPDRVDEESGILERIRRGEPVDHYETVRRRKDGSLFDVSLTISPIRADDGTVIGASKIARDITERKRSENLKEVLIAELQHRTRNLLAVVGSISSQTRFRSQVPGSPSGFVPRAGAAFSRRRAGLDRRIGPARDCRAWRGERSSDRG